MTATIPANILRMSRSRQILLVQDLWDHIAATTDDDIELSDEGERILQSRIAEMEAGTAKTATWPDIKRRAIQKLKRPRR